MLPEFLPGLYIIKKDTNLARQEEQDKENKKKLYINFKALKLVKQKKTKLCIKLFCAM